MRKGLGENPASEDQGLLPADVSEDFRRRWALCQMSNGIWFTLAQKYAVFISCCLLIGVPVRTFRMRFPRLFSSSALQRQVQVCRVEGPILSCRDPVEVCLSSPNMKTDCVQPPSSIFRNSSWFSKEMGNAWEYAFRPWGLLYENEGSCVVLFLRPSIWVESGSDFYVRGHLGITLIMSLAEYKVNIIMRKTKSESLPLR